MSQLDLLAFGAHPDDVELFCGGIVARAVRLGQRVGIVDLTAGEAASRSTPEVRASEAAAAAAILGVATRRNLGLPDARLSDTDEAQLAAVIGIVRELKPRVVLAPWERERHPDHEAAARLVTRGVFLAALHRCPLHAGERHVCDAIFAYPMRVRAPLSFVVDVTDVHATKLSAIRAHASQVAPAAGAPHTLVGSADAIDAIVARDAYVGTLAGTRFAEGLVSRRLPVIDDPVALFAGRGAAHFFEEP